ncbi:hypothetical protein I3843_11G191200 [Carya illinoinensis]|uniref:Wax synthase domain-containing protein n=1 Tax=Carya illinoinensis TaxID=32201 RepID=A0A8T1NZM8_CARIL|nr:probable long-chain-alcohol O-fatty-acyltransferase 5 [Carya illinoinensis]KAG6637696.1 hypothetical protein CIPAW_11G196200 [Carya illinoinensis]KAG6689820.1 hypothetical protein I3842_11G193300 [Carya illinoinensis]KAG7957758.1 hypothetical protein I3843_11G191200 [Carya illinoinensis]
MEGEIKSLIEVGLSVIASLSYCYFVASRIPKGKLRLLSLVPIFCLFTILPLSLTTVLPTGITALFIAWLANFKLLLFSFDLGPLSTDPPKSLPLFISIACFPIKIKQNENHPSHQNDKKLAKSSKSPLKLPQNLPTKAFLFTILMVAATSYKEHGHQKMVIAIYCCIVCLLVDIVLGSCNTIVRAILGIELELPSDDPYLSTSLQDFWGRRWNLVVSNILRHTVYKPVRSVSETVFGPQKWAPLPAVAAAFLISGLMHELLFFYVTRVAPTWEVTMFFVLHGACLVLEFWVKNTLLSQRCRLHWAVSGPLTIGFVIVTAGWLFFPPLIRNGVDARAIQECVSALNFLKAKIDWA